MNEHKRIPSVDAAQTLATPPADVEPEALAPPPVNADPTGPDDLPEEAYARRSLADDVTALVDDAKLYAEAELRFQKTRAGFAASHGKSIAIYALLAFGFLHLALIGLVVGAIIALIPTVGAWGAIGVVVGILLICIAILGLLIKRHANKIGGAFAKSDQAKSNPAKPNPGSDK